MSEREQQIKERVADAVSEMRGVAARLEAAGHGAAGQRLRGQSDLLEQRGTLSVKGQRSLQLILQELAAIAQPETRPSCEGCGAAPGEPCDPLGTCETEEVDQRTPRTYEAMRRNERGE